jgi:hypothetical protein
MPNERTSNVKYFKKWLPSQNFVAYRTQCMKSSGTFRIYDRLVWVAVHVNLEGTLFALYQPMVWSMKTKFLMFGLSHFHSTPLPSSEIIICRVFVTHHTSRSVRPHPADKLTLRRAVGLTDPTQAPSSQSDIGCKWYRRPSMRCATK